MSVSVGEFIVSDSSSVIDLLALLFFLFIPVSVFVICVLGVLVDSGKSLRDLLFGEKRES